MNAATVLLLSLLTAESGDTGTAKRVAIVVGNNQAATRGRLRYAERDARQVTEVLEKLGGVDETHLLLDRSAEDLRKIITAAGRGMKDGSTLFFFYSGHADDRALLMRDTRFEFAELRSTLQDLGAELFVAFIDACQAGSIARLKGGTAVPVVDVDYYDDKRYAGGIFITSGAPGENAQESDELEASFFTHYLLSGLRGAADESGDRRVSLDEAYRFAYRHTLERTKGTLLGPQHPSRDVDVKGRGQLVLTWLSERSSYLVLPEQARGTYFLRSEEAGEVVAEVNKEPASRVRIALEPGRYQVAKAEDGMFLSQVVEVMRRREVELDEAGMSARPLAQVQVKGGPAPSRSHLALTYRLRSGFLEEAGLAHGANVTYLFDLGPISIGPTATYAGSGYRRSDTIDIRLTEIEVGLRLEAAWRLFWRLSLFAGAELTATWTAQRARMGGADDLVSTVTFPERAVAGLKIELFSPFALVLLGHAGVVAYDTPDGPTARFVAGGGAGLELRL